MRFYSVLPLTAALASALVVPDEQVMREISVEDNRQSSYFEVKSSILDAVDNTKNAVDAALEDASGAVSDALDNIYDWAGEKESAAEIWLSDFHHAHEPELGALTEELDEDTIRGHWHDLKAAADDWSQDLGFDEPRHHGGPPRRGGPDKFRRPFGDKPRSPFPPPPPGPVEGDEREHPPHHKKPHHGKKPHHHKPNQTVYQLISKSKYTTKLTELVDQFPDVVEALNGTESNFTLFAPTDSAFEKIPKHGKEPPKEFLLRVLKYHVVPDVYPAGRVLKSRTLPTLLDGDYLSDSPKKTPQRVSINLGLKGLSINFYSRVVAINIAGTNGIIHGVDSILVPPPKAAKIIQFLPGEFSTLELGLFKTGLFSALNDTSNHLGGTIFAPTNRAWQKLGPKATGFLFSKYGEKYLKALLEYHVVPNITLYSDSIYTATKPKESYDDIKEQRTFHIDLPTLLKGKSLGIDVARFARFVDIRINGFNHVAVTDGVAKDGSLQILSNIIIPPKTPGGHGEAVEEEIDVHELVDRLEPYTKEDRTSGHVAYEAIDKEQKHFDNIPLEL